MTKLESLFTDERAWDGYDTRHDRIICRTEDLKAEWAAAARAIAARKSAKK